MAEPSSIAVFAPNWLGDAAMATPALRALHRRFPRAALHVIARPAVCALLEGLPWLTALHPLPARRVQWEGVRRVLKLRSLRPDLAIVMPHSFRAALQAKLLGASRRIGENRNGRGFLLTDALPPHAEDGRITPRYMAYEYLDLAAAAGCEDDGQGLELHAPESDLAAVQDMLDPARPVAAFAPGAAFGPSKRWPAERFAAVADALARDHGAQCLLLTGPGEEETREAVLQHARTTLIEPYGERPTIARLKAAIAAADVLIGNDSGPRHVAIAFKKPVVCIMGPTSPRYTDSPWEEGQVLRIDVDCGPCQKPMCTTDHRCMTGIGVEAVAAAAVRYLGATPRGRRQDARAL